MAEPKVFARVVGFVDVHSDTLEPVTIGDYTLHKEYEVVSGCFPVSSDHFWIIDDDGDTLLCLWHGDCDCLFERVVL